jgi:citrate synthase
MRRCFPRTTRPVDALASGVEVHMPEFARGLEGVVVASSSMSKVFGEEGNLVYRGVSIHDLARHSSFEEVVYLLWYGQLPRRSELDAFTAQLASQRRVPDAVLEWILQAPREDSMATLRTAVSMLSGYDADGNDTSLEAGRRKAERLVAMIATLVAAIGRVRDGGAPLPPDAELSHAANFLYMLSGERPSNEATRTFDQALVLHADHGFNASTFAARVTTSTLSDVHSAIVSAIGTLKGASHGGANARVMQMLLEIESSGEKPEAWVRQALERRQRIMGFGHRVYKAEDPRATHLRRSSEVLSQTTEDGKRKRACIRTWTSTPPRRTTCSASRPTCIRPSSRSAAWPAGPHTSSSRCRTIASSAHARTTRGRRT